MGIEQFDVLAFFGERWNEPRPLENFARLLDALGQPWQGMRIVHVAGTNGKGSTCAFVDRMLRRAGYRTGLFTSPALQRVNERFQIDGQNVGDDALDRAVRRVAAAEADVGMYFGGFDRMTAAGLLIFAEAGVEWLVLEAGLGGRLDATTAVPAEIAMISRIGLDHTEVLGDTIDKIAWEKAMIIQPGQRCAIVHPQEGEAMRAIEARCAETGVPLLRVDGSGLLLNEIYHGRQRFTVQRGDVHFVLETGLLGRYQIENAAAALIAGQALGLDAIAIREGIAQAEWPGRLERLEGHPMIWLDGAHNPQCMRALADSLGEYAPGQRFVLITAIMADKDWLTMLKTIAPHVECAVAVDLGARSVPAEELADALERLGTTAHVAHDLEWAFAKASDLCEEPGREDCAILVCGSLYLVGDMRGYLL